MTTDMTNSDTNQSGQNSEPLLVGTNITFDYDASENNSDIAYATDSQPLAVGTNLTIEISYSEAKALEQLGINADSTLQEVGLDSFKDVFPNVPNNPDSNPFSGFGSSESI